MTRPERYLGGVLQDSGEPVHHWDQPPTDQAEKVHQDRNCHAQGVHRNMPGSHFVNFAGNLNF